MTRESKPAAVQAGFTPFAIEQVVCDPADDDEIVLFPEYMDGETAVYRPGVIPMSKRLSAEGIKVRYAFPPERRTWLRELSTGDVLAAIAVGVGSGAPWFVLQRLLDKRKTAKMSLKVVRARKVRGRRMWDAEFVELSGTAEDVAEALRRLAEEPPNE